MASSFSLDSCRSILCFGDSLTGGWSPTEKSFQPYCNHLSELLRKRGAGTTIVNSAVSGESTDEMVPRLLERLKKGPPADCGKCFDLVLILGGTNDLAQNPRDSAAVLNNLCMLHEAACKHGAHSGAITIPYIRTTKLQDECDVDRCWVNARLCEFALQSKTRTFLVDLAAAIPQDQAHSMLWDPDCLHLSPQGYDACADLIDETAKAAALNQMGSVQVEIPGLDVVRSEQGCDQSGELKTPVSCRHGLNGLESPPALFAPGPPTDVRCEVCPVDCQVTTASLVLRWALPTNSDEVPVSHFQIEVRRGRSNGCLVVDTAVPVTQTAARLYPMLRGQPYHVSLAAVADGRGGPRWAALVSVPDLDAPPVKEVMQAGADKQILHLEWPVPSGISEISGYRIWYRASSSEEWKVLVENTRSTQPSLKFSVPFGQKYQFNVAAITSEASEVQAEPNKVEASLDLAPNARQG